MWPNTFWIQMYSLQISKNTTLDTLALYNYWLVKPHWHLITIKVWMKTLIIAPSCAHFWSWKKIHISAGMLYLECNCDQNSAIIVHFLGGPRARGEDWNSIAPTFLQYARDLVFVSFGGMLLPKSNSNCWREGRAEIRRRRRKGRRVVVERSARKTKSWPKRRIGL